MSFKQQQQKSSTLASNPPMSTTLNISKSAVNDLVQNSKMPVSLSFNVNSIAADILKKSFTNSESLPLNGEETATNSNSNFNLYETLDCTYNPLSKLIMMENDLKIENQK